MNTLQLGSQGSDVTQLQNQLNSFGYQLIVDGVFGTDTQKAVTEFQLSNNLVQDGIVGAATENALSKNSSGSAQSYVNGIDLSHNNGTVNWDIAAGNVSFVYCKASEGSTFKDPMFQQYFQELKGLNMIRGAYHFLDFQDSLAADQVANFLGAGVDYALPGILPPVLDVEWQVPQALNNYVLQNKNACIDLIADWLSAIEAETGRQPMIYTNPNFWANYLDNPAGFEKYLLWTSGYSNTPPPSIPGWTDYTFWQNSGTATVSGISGNVDTDLFKGTLDDLMKLTVPQTA